MNLLVDPLIRVETTKGTSAVTLPELMACLGRDEVEHFVGIQRHQEDAFHVFLCNLAAVVLARNGMTDPVQSTSFWRDGLRKLAGNAGDDAWTLVVDDFSRPAFMQPPLPPEDWKQLKPIEPIPTSPDALDLLPTAKNHDVKRARAMNAQLDHWIYALISLQTMSGFFGRGNPGISRMNSGFGNRSIVELVRTTRYGRRWKDAVIRLLEYRGVVLTQSFGFDENGLVLVWLKLWDGESSLSLSALDPFYIEICRRIRLSQSQDVIEASSVPSNSVRIAASQLKGVVGDAWLPVDLGNESRGKEAEDKALTVSAQGLTVDLLRRMIFGDQLHMTHLQRPLQDWGDPMWLRASVLVRGQGTTDGFHERMLRIPSNKRASLFANHKPHRDPHASLAKTAISYAGTMQRSVLRPAVLTYLQGAPDKIQFDRESAEWWTKFARQFEILWSDDYFPWLWSVPDPVDEELALVDWSRILRKHASAILREAHTSMPVRQGRFWRSLSRSEDVFWGSLYRNFPSLKEVDHERGTG